MKNAMKQFWIFLALCIAVPGARASSHVKKGNLKEYLAGVTERGRELFAYDQAAWHGTDAFFALHPDTKGLTHYICTRTPAGWTVIFPRWDPAHTRLFIAYEATEASGSEKFEAQKLDPPVEADAATLAKERALELVLASFPLLNRPYNTAILPAPDGNFYVYIYPAQTKENVWPIGGDVRFTISSDGKRIVEKRQLHKTILDMKFDPQKHAVAGFHVLVLRDVPEDTDALYVLTRKPSIPEYIRTGKRVFLINTDGSIKVLKK